MKLDLGEIVFSYIRSVGRLTQLTPLMARLKLLTTPVIFYTGETRNTWSLQQENLTFIESLWAGEMP